MDKFAPVLIPTLNRYEHFRRCVESLSRCTHAEKTDLFIALDYPLYDSHWEGYRKIKDCLPEIKGFKSINIIKRQKNYGAQNNFESGMKIIFEDFDGIIFSEDDNEFSPNFLDYMNKGLKKFENDEKVLCVCGYNYPVEMPVNYKHNQYYYKAHSAWGFATWKNRNLKLLYTPDEIVNVLKNKKFIMESVKYYGVFILLRLLIAIKQGKLKYGDGAITITMLKEDKYCIFPVVSKVRNYGHDGSGVHCEKMKDNIFINQKIDNDTEFSYSDCIPIYNKKINRELKKYFRLKFRSKLKFLYEYLSFYCRNGF